MIQKEQLYLFNEHNYNYINGSIKTIKDHRFLFASLAITVTPIIVMLLIFLFVGDIIILKFFGSEQIATIISVEKANSGYNVKNMYDVELSMSSQAINYITLTLSKDIYTSLGVGNSIHVLYIKFPYLVAPQFKVDSEFPLVGFVVFVGLLITFLYEYMVIRYVRNGRRKWKLLEQNGIILIGQITGLTTYRDSRSSRSIIRIECCFTTPNSKTIREVREMLETKATYHIRPGLGNNVAMCYLDDSIHTIL